MRGVSVVLGEELRYRLSEGLIKSGRTRQREREREVHVSYMVWFHSSEQFA